MTEKDNKPEEVEKDSQEEESTQFSPQKEVKGRPAPADYKKADQRSDSQI